VAHAKAFYFVHGQINVKRGLETVKAFRDKKGDTNSRGLQQLCAQRIDDYGSPTSTNDP
jgi:hypothetical protein